MRTWICLILPLVCLLLSESELRAQASPEVPAYVGSQTCFSCHAQEYTAWAGSHHQLAWTLPTPETVSGDFDDASFTHNGVTSRFFRRRDAFVIETDGPTGAMAEYQIIGVAGIAPLQQYLVEIEPGRVQALDTAWDNLDGRWYHLYPDQDLAGGDGLHWTGPYKSWNARCAECHATGYEKTYQPRSRSYASKVAEIGVGCEACHGPGEAHLAWAADTESNLGEGWSGLSPTGFSARFEPGTPRTEIQQCAGCHSRREPIMDSSPLPGTPFNDAYRLALLRPGLYHADGSIDDEVYVYGSFIQSKMAAKGVRCSDCHNSHSADLKADGNAACTQCHSPAGNARFPSLQQKLYDDPSHHFHEAGTAGAQCKSCHMIERVYMQIDPRRDHSFRIPRPDLAGAAGAPDACTDCHKDRDADWAAAEITRQYPAANRPAHFGEVFAFGRISPSFAQEDLAAIAMDETLPGIVRASSLDLMRDNGDAGLLDQMAPLLSDPEDLVRVAAIRLQRNAPPASRLRRLAPALEDRTKTVRITAARELLDLQTSIEDRATAESLGRGLAELQQSMFAKADYPETQLAIGGMALVLRNPRAAEQAFTEAARLDPQLEAAWSMVARIRLAISDVDGAREAVEAGLAANPESIGLQEAREALAN
ncbi:MAG: multiheme c-type cytochrome [Pseudomonadota bacterium]